MDVLEGFFPTPGQFGTAKPCPVKQDQPFSGFGSLGMLLLFRGPPPNAQTAFPFGCPSNNKNTKQNRFPFKLPPPPTPPAKKVGLPFRKKENEWATPFGLVSPSPRLEAAVAEALLALLGPRPPLAQRTALKALAQLTAEGYARASLGPTRAKGARGLKAGGAFSRSPS